ncbi:pyridoxal phosphate-dependent aminotransferase [Leucobacter sp. UCMA 4100]|uniref:pyridoxal phosphate-dependent aminotransferase n=1 Tax=Leucobacter sp. UCMA 4100 TaxID=2810534 RepID=UPI0022EA615E|nr:pyridoxal phosphate-dependent aminotransferase [Leucobacter sp. UCMA 4100]MDA3146679.1 pyridoxal phosphate-dependent aminotransferase [Leucobacter sp. UCMA 4100]
MTENSRISKKIAAIAESATLKVDAKAKGLQAQGRPVISYAAGEPDFATPDSIVAAARKALDDPKNFRYTQATGLAVLREAIAAKTLRDSGLKVDPSQIMVTNGGKHAVYSAFQTILDPGDEVILPAPYWTSYPEEIQLADGVPVAVFAGADQGYKVTVDQLEAARTDRTKALLFCSPSNPTGAVYSPDETRAIGEWALKHNLLVVTDEIYQNLTYDGVRAISIVEAVPELANNTILVNGVAKTYAMTGWRIGWMIAPADIAKGAANLQSHMTSNINNIAQIAAAEALSGPQDAVESMRQAFDRRRKVIIAELNKVDGFNCPNPEGAFYAYADVTEALGREIAGVTPQNSLELADLILDKAEVAAVPGEAFGRSGYLRFSYALGDDALLEGIQRIQNLLAK